MRRDGVTVSRNKVRLYFRDNHIDMKARHITIPTIPRVKGSVSMNAVFCADQPEPLMVLAAKACIIHQLLLDPRKLDPFVLNGSKVDADGVRSITQYYDKSAPPSNVSNRQPLLKGIVRKLSANDFGESPGLSVPEDSASEMSMKRRKTSSFSPQNVTGLLSHQGTPATVSGPSIGPVPTQHVLGLPSHQGLPSQQGQHVPPATEPASFKGTPVTATASSKQPTMSAGATTATAVGSMISGNVFVGRKRVKFSPGGPTNPQEVVDILDDKDGIDLPADDTLGERQLLLQRQKLQRIANPSPGLSGIFLQQPEYGNSTHNSLAPTPDPTPAPTPSPAPTCLQQDNPLSQRKRKQRDHALSTETTLSGNSAMETTSASNSSFSSFLQSNKIDDMFDSTDGNAGVNPLSGSWTASSFLRPPVQPATVVSHSPGTAPDGSDRPPDTQPFESGVT